MKEATSALHVVKCFFQTNKKNRRRDDKCHGVEASLWRRRSVIALNLASSCVRLWAVAAAARRRGRLRGHQPTRVYTCTVPCRVDRAKEKSPSSSCCLSLTEAAVLEDTWKGATKECAARPPRFDLLLKCKECQHQAPGWTWTNCEARDFCVF